MRWWGSLVSRASFSAAFSTATHSAYIQRINEYTTIQSSGQPKKKKCVREWRYAAHGTIRSFAKNKRCNVGRPHTLNSGLNAAGGKVSAHKNLQSRFNCAARASLIVARTSEEIMGINHDNYKKKLCSALS